MTFLTQKDLIEREAQLTASINVLGFSDLEALSDFIYLHGSATVIPSKSLPPTTLDESQSQVRNDPIQRDNRHQERRLELFTLQKHVERLEVDVKFQKGEVAKLEGTAQDQTRIIEGLRRDNVQLHNKSAKVENDEQSSVRIQLLEADNNLLEETVARLRFELQRSAPIVSPTIIVSEDQDPGDQAELITSQGHSDCYNQIEDLDRQVNSLKEQLDLASIKYDLLQVVKDELNVKLDAEGGCRRDTEVRLDESRKKYKSLERQTKINGYSTASAATTPRINFTPRALPTTSASTPRFHHLSNTSSTTPAILSRSYQLVQTPLAESPKPTSLNQIVSPSSIRQTTSIRGPIAPLPSAMSTATTRNQLPIVPPAPSQSSAIVNDRPASLSIPPLPRPAATYSKTTERNRYPKVLEAYHQQRSRINVSREWFATEGSDRYQYYQAFVLNASRYPDSPTFARIPPVGSPPLELVTQEQLKEYPKLEDLGEEEVHDVYEALRTVIHAAKEEVTIRRDWKDKLTTALTKIRPDGWESSQKRNAVEADLDKTIILPGDGGNIALLSSTLFTPKKRKGTTSPRKSALKSLSPVKRSLSPKQRVTVESQPRLPVFAPTIQPTKIVEIEGPDSVEDPELLPTPRNESERTFILFGLDAQVLSAVSKPEKTPVVQPLSVLSLSDPETDDEELPEIQIPLPSPPEPETDEEDLPAIEVDKKFDQALTSGSEVDQLASGSIAPASNGVVDDSVFAASHFRPHEKYPMVDAGGRVEEEEGGAIDFAITSSGNFRNGRESMILSTRPLPLSLPAPASASAPALDLSRSRSPALPPPSAQTPVTCYGISSLLYPARSRTPFTPLGSALSNSATVATPPSTMTRRGRSFRRMPSFDDIVPDVSLVTPLLASEFLSTRDPVLNVVERGSVKGEEEFESKWIPGLGPPPSPLRPRPSERPSKLDFNDENVDGVRDEVAAAERSLLRKAARKERRRKRREAEEIATQGDDEGAQEEEEEEERGNKTSKGEKKRMREALEEEEREAEERRNRDDKAKSARKNKGKGKEKEKEKEREKKRRKKAKKARNDENEAADQETDEDRPPFAPKPRPRRSSRELAQLDLIAKIQAKRVTDLAALDALKPKPTERRIEVNPDRNNGMSYQYSEVVRNKEQRKSMHAHTCTDCDAYYKRAYPVGEDEAGTKNYLDERHQYMQARLQLNSRHRAQARVEPDPPDYWEIGFPTTQIQEKIHKGALAMKLDKRQFQESEANKYNGLYRWAK